MLNLMNMLKNLLAGVWLSAAVLAGAVCCSNGNESKAAGEDTEETDDDTDATDDEEPQGEFLIGKGVNIGGWLSQSDYRGEKRANRIKKEDIDFLDSCGFDFIRLPVDEVQLFKEDGSIDEETLTLAKNAIEWCQDDGMRVILDLHKIRLYDISKDSLWKSTAEQDHVVSLWEAMSDEFNEYPDSLLAYGLLNEPHAPDNEQWNVLSARLIDAIRAKEANRTIVISSNYWGDPRMMEDLTVPENDKNIILEFHFYKPALLTHYLASWTNLAGIKLSVPPQYPGIPVADSVLNELSADQREIVERYNVEYDKAKLLTYWRKAIAKSKETGLRLYCGEFGCLDTGDENCRITWFNDMVSLFKENNISYSLWSYKNGGFSFVRRDGTINQPMLDALVN